MKKNILKMFVFLLAFAFIFAGCDNSAMGGPRATVDPVKPGCECPNCDLPDGSCDDGCTCENCGNDEPGEGETVCSDCGKEDCDCCENCGKDCDCCTKCGKTAEDCDCCDECGKTAKDCDCCDKCGKDCDCCTKCGKTAEDCDCCDKCGNTAKECTCCDCGDEGCDCVKGSCKCCKICDSKDKTKCGCHDKCGKTAKDCDCCKFCRNPVCTCPAGTTDDPINTPISETPSGDNDRPNGDDLKDALEDGKSVRLNTTGNWNAGNWTGRVYYIGKDAIIKIVSSSNQALIFTIEYLEIGIKVDVLENGKNVGNVSQNGSTFTYKVKSPSANLSFVVSPK